MLRHLRRPAAVRTVVALAACAIAVAVAPAAAGASGAVTLYGPLTPDAKPFGITGGPDGGVWFVMPGNGTAIPKPIGRIDPATGTITDFASAAIASTPKYITTGPDGNLWFTDQSNSAVGRITPAGAAVAFAGAGLNVSGPRGIATGPNGNLFVVSATNNLIVEVKPDGTKASETAIPSAGSNPQEIVAGPDGNMWFTENSDPGKVGRLNVGVTPHTITEFTVGKSLLGVGVGADGNIYATEASGTPKLHRISTLGADPVASNPLTAGTSDPESLAKGRDGAMWFTIFNGSQIGRIAPDMTIQQFPTGSGQTMGPREIAEGPDGNMWFTDDTANKIGKVAVDAPVVTTPTTPTTTTPTTPDTTRPVLSRLKLSATTFAAGKKVTAQTHRKRAVGTTISYRLSEAARVTMTVERAVAGRRQGGACRAATKANRTAKRCTRYVRALVVRTDGKAGANSVKFTGRVGKKALATGAYRLSLTARDAAGNATSRAVATRFALVRPR